jgi:peptidoglycan hydrolase CwlO-like protein
MKLDIQHGMSKELAGVLSANIRHQEKIAEVLSALIKNQEKIMADLSGVRGAVEGLTTVVDSANALLENLAQQVRETAPNQEALDELANQIDAQRQELAAAVAANTEGGAAPTAEPRSR